jgi:hypothetical protein
VRKGRYVAPMDKAEVARRQLGTALHLFLHQQDPVSAHCLACGGGEIAEWLAKTAAGESFATHALESFPELKASELRSIRNRHWNAFKHASTRDGLIRRGDDVLLAEFKPSDNEHFLFIGWYDYGLSAFPMPVEAQAFQIWYLAKYPAKVNPLEDFAPMRQHFPDLFEMPGDQQLARLIDTCRKCRENSALLEAPGTDPRPLVLS